MNEKLVTKLYARLPIPLQNAACTAYGLRERRARYGPEFHRRLESLEASDRWSRGDIDAYQDEQVAALVRHAYQHVPFYRARMKALGLTPADVRSRADLPKLPILTKEDVRQNRAALVAVNADPRRLRHSHTSGTTGKSLQFEVTADSQAFQWAVWWRHRRRFGLRVGDLHANFMGKLVVPPSQSRPPFWRWNWAFHQALIPMQQVTPEKVRALVAFLEEHPFVFWSGYPSIHHALARAALDAGLTMRHPPRAIVTGAENLLEVQRRDLERFTGAVVADQYGFSEGCGNASQCAEAQRYHEDFEFSVLECVDPEPLPDGRTLGKIVCTGFSCWEFPFLRYEVGDWGVWSREDDPCPCGRHSRAIERVEGRADDYVLTPEGSRIMRFDYLFKDSHEVRECQVVQERLGEIVLRVVRRPGYSVADERALLDEVRRWISPSIEVRFDYVPVIAREASGKFRAVKSCLREGRAASAVAA
ncbi:MAG: hypothetical protein R3A52_11915 [Polyangiales bacterium]